MNAKTRANQVYLMTGRTATPAAIVQASSALFGGLFHIAVDVASVAFYVDLWNGIRSIYGKGQLTKDVAVTYLRPNLGFILGDLLLDKLLGMVPVAGSAFCYVFARALTWRLGALFGVLACLGEDVPESLLLEKVSELVQVLFPRGHFLFTLADPDRKTFVSLISGLEGLDATAAEARITTALNVLRGDYAVEEIRITFGDEGGDDADNGDDPDEDAAIIGTEVNPLAPWDGVQALAEDEEDAALMEVWRTVWRQWQSLQSEAVPPEADAEMLARTMPLLLTMKEDRAPLAARQLLLALNANGEIGESGQNGDSDRVVPFVIPAVTGKQEAPPSLPGKPKPPVTPKKKPATQKKVLAKSKHKKTGSA